MLGKKSASGRFKPSKCEAELGGSEGVDLKT